MRASDWDAVVDVSWKPSFVVGALAALGARATHWTYVSSGSVYLRWDVAGEDESAELHEPLDADIAEGWEVYGQAKARCEQEVRSAVGDRALRARAGLIGGPGDQSDRLGYWPSRFALARDGPVLVPNSPDLMSQTIDVRDIAMWIIDAPGYQLVGPFNAVGETQPFSAVIEIAADTADFRGEQVPADPAWLEVQGVQMWSGPRSLPLWLPTPEYAGYSTRTGDRAFAAGLVSRPIAETLADTLADEREGGLDRPRKACLERSDELALIALLTTAAATTAPRP